MTYPHPENDPYSDAMTDEPQYLFGQVSVDAIYVVLVKNKGRVPYNPGLHADQRKSTEITFNITPVDPTRRLVSRATLNWAADFKGVIRPSIEALAGKIAEAKGLDANASTFNPLREINGLWVGGQLVPRPDNKPGQTWTTIEFSTVFADRAACEAAYAASKAEHAATQGPSIDETIPFPSDTHLPDPERQAMAGFLPQLWQVAQGQAGTLGEQSAAFMNLIAANPMLAKHFDLNSPEVRALTGGQGG